MAKRVVDDSSLVAIGNAIRAKTGTSDPISFPNGMVEAISGITTGSNVTILENQGFELNFSAGNMVFDLGETLAVRSGTIYKPDTLVSENIRDGVTIAGITGNMTSGGVELPEDVHRVTFMNDGEVLWVRSVADGDNCADVADRNIIGTPTKESTAQYEYTFSGWSLTNGGSASSTALSNVTGDRTVYAAYTTTVREYTITYYDEDGVTVLNTQTVKYGYLPSYKPVKEGTAFDTWIPSLAAVTGNASYTAKWSNVVGGGALDTNTSITWAVTADGTLKISGEGEVKSASATGAPYYVHNDVITNLVVEEGITKIGKWAFANLTNLKKAKLANSVTSISGESAFYRCDLSDGIEWGGVVYITGSYAFQNTNLATPLPQGIIAIGDQTFRGCKFVGEMVIPETVTTYVGKCFYSCASITKMTYRNALKIMQQFELYRMTALTEVNIPASVTTIQSGCVSGCDNLTRVVFENTNGWQVSTSSSMTDPISVDVSNPETAATMLRSTYKTYYWKRSG